MFRGKFFQQNLLIAIKISTKTMEPDRYGNRKSESNLDVDSQT